MWNLLRHKDQLMMTSSSQNDTNLLDNNTTNTSPIYRRVSVVLKTNVTLKHRNMTK